LSRKRRADKDEDDEPGSGQDRLGEAIGEGVLFVIGLYMIYVSNWNWLLIGIGAVFAGSPVLQIPAIRIAINNKTGHQIFKVSNSEISDSTVIQSARDVHIYHAPPVVPQPQPQSPPQKTETQEPEWEVEEEFTLSGEDYRAFPIDLERGERLLGLVEAADDDVSCYVLGVASLSSFEEGENFNPYWESEDVTKTRISFVAPGKRTYYFVIDHQDEDEEASVSVKLRVES